MQQICFAPYADVLGPSNIMLEICAKKDDIKILNFAICHADDIMPTFKLMIAHVFFE